MHTQSLHTFILMIILTSTPLCNAALPEWITNNTTHIAWGTGTLLVTGVTYLIADNNSTNKYAHLENKAKRDKECADEEYARNEKLNEERKATAERRALEEAQDFLQSFEHLIETFSSTPQEELAKNEDFQHRLLMLVLGRTSNTKPLNELNDTVAYIKNNIYAIDNPNLSNEKKNVLNKLTFILQQANNNAHIHSAQQNLTRAQLEIEHAQYIKQISAERLIQAQMETESTKKVCALNEKSAKDHTLISQALHKTTQNMSMLFHRATGNIEGQLKTIGSELNNTMQHGLEQLNTWQAARAQEHTETHRQYTHIASIITALIHTLETTQSTMDLQATLLNHIEDKLNKNQETAETILANLPEDSRIALEKHIAHTAYESEQRIIRALAQALDSHQKAMYVPSTPPMSPEDE